MAAESMQVQTDALNSLGKQKSVHPSIVTPIGTCTLRVDGIEAKIPVLQGTDGIKMLDI
jgi:hypothetical protein